VKAAAQDQWKLLDLAQTDRRIAQAEHRRRTLPELAELKDPRSVALLTCEAQPTSSRYGAEHMRDDLS
jgi:hypothetical protein